MFSFLNKSDEPPKKHDRRKATRNQIQHTLLVRFNGDKVQFGKITDISSQGLGFSYNSNWQKFVDRTLEIDLFDCLHGKVLERLPIRVVRNKADSRKIGGQPLIIMNNGASFEKLSDDQEKILDFFIDQFSVEQ